MSRLGNVAFFPISLSNQRFGTDNVIKAIQSLGKEYTKVVFVVANTLQHYNKALLIEDKSNLKSVIKEFEAEVYFEERKRWLAKLIRKLDSTKLEIRLWDLVNLDDEKKWNIYRKLLICYAVEEDFRNDVIQLSQIVAKRFRAERDESLKERLSVNYIMEELAYSVRIHLIEGLHDEYYFGRQSKVVLKLYKGEYGFLVEDLVLGKNSIDVRFFYPLEEEDGFRWMPYDDSWMSECFESKR